MAATAQADEPWPTFGNPYVFTEQGGEAISARCARAFVCERSTAPAGRRTYPSPAADSRLAAFNYPIRVVLEGQKAIRRLLRADERAGRRCCDLIHTHFGNSFDDAPTAEDGF
jgi:hypothetical protein